ncbi:hypothetical protein GGH94_001938 [Coemansia aciculifera]|uniref:Uncharacterized protein n=1 Tax=Coemansia aciculifera TaxID=417176 RepID=A0A9W8ITB7_9FUNG|nr:hypothetical protein GGH94_001938 [Coemansia aciculifera]
MSCICSGLALKMLSRTPYNGCAFPLSYPASVASAKLHWGDQSESDTNISAFVQQIKEMVPRLDKVKVVIYTQVVYRYQRTIRDLSSLASQLYLLAIRVEYDARGWVLPLKLQIDSICNLAHINCSCFDSSDEAVQLARQSSSTLQVLSIKMHMATDIPSLIHDGDGKYAEYPCLHTLKLEYHRALRLSPRPVFGGVSFPPKPQRLNIKANYPFGEDTLFRGNAATLEYLSMRMDPETVSMFKKYNVFTPTSHPKLQCVEVGDMLDLVPAPFATSVEYTRFVLAMAPGASV